MQRSVEQELACLGRLEKVEAVAVVRCVGALRGVPRHADLCLGPAEKADRDCGPGTDSRRGADDAAGDHAAGLAWLVCSAYVVQLDFQFGSCFVCCWWHGVRIVVLDLRVVSVQWVSAGG